MDEMVKDGDEAKAKTDTETAASAALTVPIVDTSTSGAAASMVDAPADSADTHSATPASDTPKGEESNPKLAVALRALRSMEQQLINVIRLLEKETGMKADAMNTAMSSRSPPIDGFRERVHAPMDLQQSGNHRIVEGVFDGYRMVGGDGKNYSVPPNYASKSKLVEGDMLKLTITPKGTFIYKQIGPIERQRIVGLLGFDQGIGEYFATSGARKWSLLKASVTYFRGDPGDKVVLLVPKNTPSKWAAVENIIKKDPMVSV